MTGKFQEFAILFLAISILISGFLIADAIKDNSEKLSEVEIPKESLLMDSKAAAAFLGIELNTFFEILNEDNAKIEHPIPYIPINGHKYFTKNKLIQWAEINMYHY